jgi:hypothetical protein
MQGKFEKRLNVQPILSGTPLSGFEKEAVILQVFSATVTSAQSIMNQKAALSSYQLGKQQRFLCDAFGSRLYTI